MNKTLVHWRMGLWLQLLIYGPAKLLTLHNAYCCLLYFNTNILCFSIVSLFTDFHALNKQGTDERHKNTQANLHFLLMSASQRPSERTAGDGGTPYPNPVFTVKGCCGCYSEPHHSAGGESTQQPLMLDLCLGWKAARLSEDTQTQSIWAPMCASLKIPLGAALARSRRCLLSSMQAQQREAR